MDSSLLKAFLNKQVFTVGLSTFIVGVLVLLFWIPLREVPGIGTISNIILISISIDVMAPFHS